VRQLEQTASKKYLQEDAMHYVRLVGRQLLAFTAAAHLLTTRRVVQPVSAAGNINYDGGGGDDRDDDDDDDNAYMERRQGRPQRMTIS
jgi:hypothetical protein